MNRISPRAIVALLALALPLCAQPPAGVPLSDEARADLGATAWVDYGLLATIIDLNLTTDQANAFASAGRDLQEQFGALEANLVGLAVASAPEAQTVAAAVLAGQPAPPMPTLARFEQARDETARRRLELLGNALQTALNQLTDAQRELVANGDSLAGYGAGAAPPEMRIAERGQRDAWRATAFGELANLVMQARGEMDEGRYNMFAPQAALRLAAGLLGLPPQSPPSMTLAQTYLNQLQLARRLPPDAPAQEIMRFGAHLLRLTQRAMGAVGSLGGAQLGPASSFPTTSEVELLLSSPRGPLVLGAFARLAAAPGK